MSNDLTYLAVKHISNAVYKKIEGFLGGKPFNTVSEQGKVILQGLIKDSYQRTHKESEALHELRLRLKKDHPTLAWDALEIAYRTFILGKIVLKSTKHSVLQSLSSVGQQKVFRDMAMKDFKFDLAHGYLPPEEYNQIHTAAEKYKKYEHDYFKNLAGRQGEDGVSFRKAFNIPNTVTNPDIIENLLLKERGVKLGNETLYRMVEENPGLDNEGLLRKLQKIPDDKPFNLGDRQKINYRTQLRIWVRREMTLQN